MKKSAYLAIGFIVGAIAMFSGQAIADTVSNVGKKVQVENAVVVNGVELPVKAVNIGGSTFTPNRALADAIGYDIAFVDNTVQFTSKSEQGGVNIPVDTTINVDQVVEAEATKMISSGKYTLENIDSYIESQERSIASKEEYIESLNLSEKKGETVWERQLSDLKIGLDIYKAIKVKLQAQQ